MAKRSRAIKEAAEKEDAPPEKFSRRDYLSSGSTMLNLALTDNPYGAFRKGCYYQLVGDSSSGKTFTSRCVLAEAAANPAFAAHRLIFDDVECGSLMDNATYFGQAMADKLEAPSVDAQGDPVHSDTIEDFYYHLDDALEDGRPFIYVLDSSDALSSEKETEEFGTNKTLTRRGKEAKGSYGDGKAKKNSAMLRAANNKLKKTDSILIILTQTRTDLGYGPQTKTSSGGKALEFFAAGVVWSSTKAQITKQVQGKKRNIGKELKVQVKKNRHTGCLHDITSFIYPSYGIDDMESCISYLCEEGHWNKKGAKITAPEFKHEGTMATLIAKVEEQNATQQVQALAGKLWNKVKTECSLKRKPRYQ